MADIFISYSSKDREKAEQLTELLASAGLSVWIDQSGIGLATSWSREIVQAINGCTAFIVLLSEAALSSHNVIKEVSLASEKRKKIIPLEVEPVVLTEDFEYQLAGLQRTSIKNVEAILSSLGKLSISSHEVTKVPPVPLGDKLRLAVLPFEDQSSAKDNEWFADGMMDELIGTLGSLSQLHVNPRTDVIYYKMNKPKMSEIAADLKCRYIVEGAVQKAGEKIRIRVSLSDALERKQIWSEKYDGSFDDIFDLQDKTCYAITEALKLKLSPEEEKQIDVRPTKNSDAYELYLKAMQSYTRQTKLDFERAFTLFTSATSLDPKFALAYAGLARTYCDHFRLYTRNDKWLDLAQSAVKQYENIEGHTAAWLTLRSLITLLRGKPAEAVTLVRNALELDPTSGSAYEALGFALLELGNTGEAVEAAGHFARSEPNNKNALFYYLIALSVNRETEKLRLEANKALPVFMKYVRANPDDIATRVEFASTLIYADKKEEALVTVNELAALETLDSRALYNLSCDYSLIGGHGAEALALLRRSMEVGYADIETMRRDPDLDSLRGEPEFEKLMLELEKQLKK